MAILLPAHRFWLHHRARGGTKWCKADAEVKRWERERVKIDGTTPEGENLIMTTSKPKRQFGKVARNTLVEFHVVPNGNRFDVERDDAFTGSFAFEVNTAIGLAIAAAHREYDEGVDVMVCVQEPNGHCRKVWP